MHNVGQIAEARRLVLDHHYSGRMPSNIQLCATWHAPGGLFGDCGDATAACLFSIPPTRWSVPILELSRLVRHPGHEKPLTHLISWACKRARHDGWDLVVSFADWTQHHRGGIYQAASWKYGSFRDSCVDGLVIDGAFVPGRSCNSAWGSRSRANIAALMPDRVVTEHRDAGKYLYWRALTKKGAKMAADVGLEALPYPKPERVA